MERTKRLPKTPLSALKNNVAENLLDSVEKLKRLKISKDNVESKESKARRCLTAVISEPEDRTLHSLSIPDRLFEYGLNCYICS